MKRYQLTTIGLISLLLLNGCFTDPNKKANELYVHATAIIKNSSTEATSYSESYEKYKIARKDIEHILHE